LLDEADLVLMVRSRVPWYPPHRGPEKATVVALDENPFRTHMVYQNLQIDVFLEGDVAVSLRMLAAAVRASPPENAELARRRARWSGAHSRMQERAREELAKAREGEGIHPLDLCATLGEVLPQDAIYVDETTTHRGQIQRFLPYSGPQSFFRVSSGLGQGLGMSLGVRLASKDRPVVLLIGDGAFLYNPVLPALGLSKSADLPILIVLFNNQGYKSMTGNQLAYYPEGVGVRHELFLGEAICGADYERLAEPYGALGIRIDQAAKLKTGLAQAYAAVRGGRTAIVNAVLRAAKPQSWLAPSS
jgi:thiamine pyrophosphate-dependent acetolactate synthase large subunit-like protein